ncbi:hypothetical protein AYL99_04489 [Fonsecaea erecta]|uniref:RBR-type E3 ubiquitin transferase n=1 Tax=Fonsecaea erecta TaxID=1367422 RepID=A0A178ZSB8_9EURO|nr:hypothetical protein AYL99_04489 [Fonsecaea erecta]OAP62286.1 hypothetical protein AYL99_04489 [Fonsecaea erecta]
MSLLKPRREISENISEAFYQTTSALDTIWTQAASVQPRAEYVWLPREGLCVFDSPTDARALVCLAQTDVSDLGVILCVATLAAVTVPVLRELHAVLKDRSEELQSNNNDDVRISAYNHREVKLVMLRIYGWRPQAVAHVKKKLGEMLTGTVVLDDSGSALWHGLFATNEGLSSLKAVSQSNKVFVYKDLRKQQLQLYGLGSLFEDTRRAIIQLLSSLSSMYLISLGGELFGSAVSGGFCRLVRQFGRKSATLDILQKPPAIVFRANSLILESPLEVECQQVNTSEECPCCFSTADNPIRLECGHTYCRCCFEGLCEEVKHNKVPILCFEDCSKCGQIDSLTELKGVLKHDKFEAILEASFDSYIRSHPEMMQYCPTPDCPTIYKVSEAADMFTCVNCLTSICSHC